MPLSSTATENIKSTLDGVVKEGATGLAGVVFIAIDKSGQPLIQHASGTRSLNSTDPMDLDTTFWIASCTKVLTAIAAWQQIEAGKIPLDDASFVAQHAPEIKAKKVYADGVTPAEQQKQVTMRMLISHTAGFAYSFLDPRVQGVDEFIGLQDEIMKSPMVNQPGGMWEYSISLDWVGIILERYLGQKLGDIFQKNILAPLGIKDMTMTPTPEMRQNLAQAHQRDMSNGEIKERNYIYEAGLYSAEKTANEQFHSGGAGLFAKPVEYVKVLGALLNGGKSPETGERILKEESVDAMWENQIPGQPDFARGAPPPAIPTLSNPSPEIYPQPNNPPQGWNFLGFLTIPPTSASLPRESGVVAGTGRGANTTWWAGLPNLFWWVDRQKGVAGLIAAQVLPFGDPVVAKTWGMVEAGVYAGL